MSRHRSWTHPDPRPVNDRLRVVVLAVVYGFVLGSAAGVLATLAVFAVTR